MNLRTAGTVLRIVILAAFVPGTTALAHGEPVIAVDPAIVAAGGSVTVTGTEMEPGEIFSLTLENGTTTIPLGQATAEGEGEEAGFAVTLSLPADLAPGSYTLRAATEEGETSVADLTVTAATSQADPGPAMVQEPSGAPHVLDRRKPSGQIVGISALAAVGAVLGVWLIRRR